MPPGWLTGYFDVLVTNMQTELVQLLQGKTDSSMQSNTTVLHAGRVQGLESSRTQSIRQDIPYYAMMIRRRRRSPFSRSNSPTQLLLKLGLGNKSLAHLFSGSSSRLVDLSRLCITS